MRVLEPSFRAAIKAAPSPFGDGRSAERIGVYYRTLTMNGERVRLDESEGAGPCGTEFAPHGPH